MADFQALSVPPTTLGTLDVALVVAFVAHHDPHGRRVNGVELSERQAQKLLAVASRSTMHKRLRSAQDLGLLEVVSLSGTGDLGRNTGNTYRLGPVARKLSARREPFKTLAPPAGLEPATCGLGNRCSIH